MKTRRWAPVVFAAMVLAFVAVACKDSNTVVAPPAGPANVEGSWVGTFESVDFIDCDSGTAASATLTQTGSTVEGVLHMAREGCGVTEVGFHGTIESDRLQGALDHHGHGSFPYHFEPGSTADGLVTGTGLELTLHNGSPLAAGPIPGGTMHLHR